LVSSGDESGNYRYKLDVGGRKKGRWVKAFSRRGEAENKLFSLFKHGSLWISYCPGFELTSAARILIGEMELIVQKRVRVDKWKSVRGLMLAISRLGSAEAK